MGTFFRKRAFGFLDSGRKFPCALPQPSIDLLNTFSLKLGIIYPKGTRRVLVSGEFNGEWICKLLGMMRGASRGNSWYFETPQINISNR